MDDDLARQLPDPPPPRPAARRAALDAAMARFDGIGAASPSPSAQPWRDRPARTGWRLRPGPLGALASIALVALVGIPMALDHRDLPSEVARPRPVPAAQPERVVADRTAPAPAPAQASAGKAAQTTVPVMTKRRPAGTQEDAAPPPPPPPPAPAPVAAPPPPPPPPPAPMAPPAPLAQAAPSVAHEITVTGSRLSRDMHRSGDSAPASSPAETAWRDGQLALAAGNPAAAIVALDRAIALRPGFAAAYLDRASAYRAQGDLAKAEADADRLLRHDRSARAYRLRSDIRAARGDTKGARKDRERAERLEDNGAAR